MKLFTLILLTFLTLFLIIECDAGTPGEIQKSKSKANKTASNADRTVPNDTNKKKAKSNAKPEKQAKLEIVPVPATQPGLASKLYSIAGRAASTVVSVPGVGPVARAFSNTVGSVSNSLLKTVGLGVKEKEVEAEKSIKKKQKVEIKKVSSKANRREKKEKSTKTIAVNPDIKKLATIVEGLRKKKIHPSPQNSPRKSVPNSPISPANKMAEKPMQKPSEMPKIAFGRRVYDHRKEESQKQPKLLDEINPENSLLKVVKHVCVNKTAKYRDCQKLETRGICPLAQGFIHALTPKCVELELVKETGKPGKYGYEDGHENVTCCKNKYAKKGKDWELDNEKAEESVKEVMEVLKIEAIPQKHEYLKKGKSALASKPVLPLLNDPKRSHSFGGETYGNPKNSIVENDSGLAQNDMDNSPGMFDSIKKRFRSATSFVKNTYENGKKYVQENPKKVAATTLLLTTGAGFAPNAFKSTPPVHVTGTHLANYGQITNYGGAGAVRTFGAPNGNSNGNFVGNKLALAGPHDVQAYNGNSAQFAKHFGITEKGLKEVQDMEENKDFEPFHWGNNPKDIPEWENTPDTLQNKNSEDIGGSGGQLKVIEKNYQDDKIQENNNEVDFDPRLNDDVDEARDGGVVDNIAESDPLDTRDAEDDRDFNNPPGPGEVPSEDVNDAPESSDLYKHEKAPEQDGGGNEGGLRGFEQLEHDDLGGGENDNYKETGNGLDENIVADDQIKSGDSAIQGELDTGKEYTED